MKNLRLVVFLGGTTFVASASMLVACSSDDTVVTVTPDSGDTGTPDGGKADVDTTDANQPDTNPPFDGGFKPATFAGNVAEALCNTLTRCCFNQNDVPDGGAVDGGKFDRSRCVDIYKDLGFEGSLVGEDEAMLANVTLDQTKAADCIAKIDALQCNLTGADLKAARSVCFGALAGKLAPGQPCRASLECAPGNFCLPLADGGVPADGGADGGAPVIGQCAALRAQGQNCSIVETNAADYDSNVLDSNVAEEACSYRGGGDTNLRCASYDPVGQDYKSRDQWTCETTVANDEVCNSTVWCSNGICDPTNGDYVCRSPVVYFTPEGCGSFVKP